MSPERGLAVIPWVGVEVGVGTDEDSKSAAWPGVVADSVAVGAEEEAGAVSVSRAGDGDARRSGEG
jgi:hypothetical protein